MVLVVLVLRWAGICCCSGRRKAFENLWPDCLKKLELSFWNAVVRPLRNGARRDVANLSGRARSAEGINHLPGVVIFFGHL